MTREPRPRRLISVRQAADRLGGVCTRTVERLCANDPDFPTFEKIGRRNYIFEDQFDAWLDGRAQRHPRQGRSATAVEAAE